MKVWDVVIIGAGAVGAAAAHFLKKKDPTKEILILEKHDGFGRGATGAWGSLIRVFSIRAGIAEKATTTLPYFLNFEEHVGAPCGFVETGCLYFYPKKRAAEVDAILGPVRSKSSTEMHLLRAEEGRIRFPDFQWEDDDSAIFEPQAGYACPWTTTGAWIGNAETFGLESRTGVTVRRLITEGNQIVGVETDSEERISCRTVLISGGVWTDALTSPLGITLDATAHAIQVNRLHYRSSKKTLPTFLDMDTLTFARPAEQGTLYGGYLVEATSDVRAVRQPLSLPEANEAKKRLSRRLKALRTSELAGGVRALEMYSKTYTPVVGFNENYRNLYLATGWSCTGFTLSPYYGEKIADELLEVL